MLVRFLRFFALYRALEAELFSLREQAFDRAELQGVCDSLRTDVASLQNANQQLITEKLLLEDRLTAALDDKSNLWKMVGEALDNERSALRMQINHATQRLAGGIPYPDAHALPPNAVPPHQQPGPIGRSARILPSELAARQSRQFVTEFVQSLDPEKRAS